jgi:DNA-binding CsgD family transcriptional regulator
MSVELVAALRGIFTALSVVSKRLVRPTLTPREREIVEAMMTAASNRAIADRLGITEQSVKNRLTSLYRKFAVRNRLALVVKLLNRGM